MPRRHRNSEGPSDQRRQQQRRNMPRGGQVGEKRPPDRRAMERTGRQGTSDQLEARLDRMERMIGCLLPKPSDMKSDVRRDWGRRGGDSEGTPTWTPGQRWGYLIVFLSV